LKILLVAATAVEIAPTLQWLENNFAQKPEGAFYQDTVEILPLITGIGITPTAYHLGRIFATTPPDLAINAGIAGAFDQAMALGSVVQVATERFGDLGVEEADGQFTDLFELGLVPDNATPFTRQILQNPGTISYAFLPAVHGLTVQKVHGHAPSIQSALQKYPEVQIESMEGAAFFYACLLSEVSFLEIRSISNYVAPRNRAEWQLPLAIQHLNDTIIDMLKVLQDTPNEAEG